MSDTPETDELARSLLYERLASTETCYSEMRMLARKLERERDEARADLEFRRDLFKLQEQQLNEVRAERDAIKEQLDAAIMLGKMQERRHERELAEGGKP